MPEQMSLQPRQNMEQEDVPRRAAACGKPQLKQMLSLKGSACTRAKEKQGKEEQRGTAPTNCAEPGKRRDEKFSYRV